MNDQGIPLGLLWPSGKPIMAPIDLVQLGTLISSDADRLADQPTNTLPGWTFDEFQPAAPKDPGDAKQSGWTVVIGVDDPNSARRLERVQPLMDHRGATASSVLRFPGGDEAARSDWIDESYLGLGDARPRYLLLLGDPIQLPFELQASLAATGASVGRLDFDTDEDLDRYIVKILAHESPTGRSSTPEAVVFAPNYGGTDATVFSSSYLVPPVEKSIKADGRYTVVGLSGEAATKAALQATFERHPALVFTASHGASVKAVQGQFEQERVNGAWCCARQPGEEMADWILTGGELPANEPVWSNALVVQFACWGYGTPATSTFQQWTGRGDLACAIAPFCGSIPKRLLANPEGPIGYVGHVDTAWLHGFADPRAVPPAGAYSQRVEPLLTLVHRAIADLTAAGYALGDLVACANAIASEVSNLTNRLRQRHQPLDSLGPTGLANLADQMIRRNDAMWFLFFGDPGVRVQVGT